MAVTPAHCGQNVENHAIAGGEGIAKDPQTAQILAWMLFLDAWFKADASLREYASQPCPAGCIIKTPKNPEPTYAGFDIKLRWDPGAPARPAVPAVPAVPAQPAVAGHPARPARPATPGHPAVPAQPAVVGHPAIPGRPAIPARPAVPAREAAWICVIAMMGTVTFDCAEVGG